MLVHRRRRETQTAGANPWLPARYGRSRRTCYVAPSCLYFGVDYLGAPYICTDGGRNAARRTLIMDC